MYHSPQGLWHHKFKVFWGRHKYNPLPREREATKKNNKNDKNKHKPNKETHNKKTNNNITAA